MAEPWRALHARAVDRGARSYIDPASGYLVFTELTHLDRGTCCGSGCRHCPFGHASVDGASLDAHAPRLLGARRGPPERQLVDVVSWSGGKDAWLAWQTCDAPAVWLTTYDPVSGTLPIQEVTVDTVVRQAARARVPLLLSPVGPDRPVADALVAGLDVVARRWDVRRVVFGDIWLSDVPRARHQALDAWLDAHGASLHLPLWERPSAELLDRLWSDGPRVHIRASRIAAARAGDPYDRAFVEALPEGVDPMGEGGEFHTEVEPTDLRPVR